MTLHFRDRAIDNLPTIEFMHIEEALKLEYFPLRPQVSIEAQLKSSASARSKGGDSHTYKKRVQVKATSESNLVSQIKHLVYRINNFSIKSLD